MSRFQQLTQSYIDEIEALIASDSIPDHTSSEELYEIAKQLKKMGELRDSKRFIPSYPHWIGDTWDYRDRLGERLLEVAELYSKL